MVAASPKPLAYLRDKEPTDKCVRMAKWIKQNGGGEIDPKAIQIALRADGMFQKSEENQAYLNSRREQIVLEKQAREERAQQRAERAEAREAAKAEKAAQAKASPKASAPPVKKAPVKAAAKPTAATKAPAKSTARTGPAAKPAAKRTPKARAAAGANFDGDDF